jgi:DNA-binding protein HU-beta
VASGGGVWFGGWPRDGRKALAIRLTIVTPSSFHHSESYLMATRPVPAKKGPVKKAAAKRPTAAALTSKPVAAAPATRAAVGPVVTLKAVFEQLGEAHALPRKQAHGLLADFVAAMTTHLKRGDRIRMSGLGILEVKTRGARIGRNPATGEFIEIKASKKVTFRATKELKEAV